jgi:hypothetical protein
MARSACAHSGAVKTSKSPISSRFINSSDPYQSSITPLC